MFKLGITGSIGSGKSTAAKFFKKKNATIFDADKEAKEHILSSSHITDSLIKNFGSQILSQEKIDFNKLSELVFSNKNYLEELNNIIWPEVYLIMKNNAEIAKNSNCSLFVVDAALLYEAGYEHYFDTILVITASKQIRYQRIIERKNIPQTQIQKRMEFQMPDYKKRSLTKNIIENNGNLSHFNMKLESFYMTIN